ncbi:unnamed protein product [Sphagnum jensenii]|uniref:Pectin acetylesterase n=1 Tax=Sphagnum jensenii TaxID=128206 RepID=A0ABP0VTB2_9BRYO
MELKRRQTADAPNWATWRRDVSGMLVFTFVFLLGSLIVILIWNFEELQGVLRLLPARESFKDAGDATSVGKPTIEEEVAAGAGIVGAEALKDKKKQKPENDGTVGGGGEANLAELEPLVVDLTILTKAADIGAVCLDGTPPGYHLHKGSGANANNWVVFLEEGAWCHSEENCKQRSKTNLGSSKFMKPQKFDGILSNSEQVNPDFFNWNRVFVRYCDGASFSGNSSLPADEKGNWLQLKGPYYRGESIWEAIIAELLSNGMVKADKALLGGCSAGGLSSILHCDKFKAALPGAKVVKCMSDAGFFVDMPTYKGENKFGDYFRDIVNLQRVGDGLLKECTKERDSADCFFPQYLLPHIKTPLFIVNGGYDWWQMDNIVTVDTLGEWNACKNDAGSCTDEQFSTIQDYRTKLLEALKPVEDSQKDGMFIDGCFHHCQTSRTVFWNGPQAPRINNKTASEALGDWYFERLTATDAAIDCRYPCNPACGFFNRSPGKPSFRKWSRT